MKTNYTVDKEVVYKVGVASAVLHSALVKRRMRHFPASKILTTTQSSSVRTTALFPPTVHATTTVSSTEVSGPSVLVPGIDTAAVIGTAVGVSVSVILVVSFAIGVVMTSFLCYISKRSHKASSNSNPATACGVVVINRNEVASCSELIFSVVELVDEHFLRFQYLQVILVHDLAQEQAVQLDCSSLVQGRVDAHALEGTSVLHLQTHQVLQEIRLHLVLEPLHWSAVFNPGLIILIRVMFVRFQPIEVNNQFLSRSIYISGDGTSQIDLLVWLSNKAIHSLQRKKKNLSRFDHKHLSVASTLLPGDALHCGSIPDGPLSYCGSRLLKELDGDRVEPGDGTNALRQFVSSHLSITTILSHAHTDATPPPSLFLLPTASFFNKESRLPASALWNGNQTPFALQHLPNLKWTLFADNALVSMEHLQAVTELYLSSNMLDSTRELFHLKSLSQLSVLDISSNPIGQTQQATRLFVIYHLTTLKALDGEAIESDEIAAAKEKLGGRLNQDMVLEQLHNVPFSSLKKMDFPNCSLKHVDLSPVDSFSNLLSLNLESNSLTSFSGLIYLNQLKILCLNHICVEVMIRSHDLPSGQSPAEGVLRSLKVLHLAYNGINDLIPLQLNKLVSLKALFLQGNEIVLVEGLDGMKSLTELVLDRNKIKVDSSLLSLRSLRELHIEENRLKELCNFSSFVNLERLYIGMNRIQDFGEVEKLCDLPQVMELSLISNPLALPNAAGALLAGY
ncbi:hypothetical protein EMCRGX_G014328 [Ephydatia muelleri]